MPSMPANQRFANAALIYNPISGRLRGKRQRDFERAVELLTSSGIPTTLIPTTCAGSATELARREVAKGRDLIIACGGDGTINEVVNGMAGSSVPLGILPAGTANVLAKELGLPWDLRRAAGYIPRGTIERIALGRAGERYFIAVAGVGADANIVYHLNERTKLRWGILTYWLESFRQLFLYDFPPFSVRVNGEDLTATLAIISRTKHYGGPIRLTRRANLFGGEFEVCAFTSRSRFIYLLYFLGQLAGVLERFPGVCFLRAERVRAQPGPARIYVEVDGELAGELPMEFAIVPDALSLVVPSRSPAVPTGGTPVVR